MDPFRFRHQPTNQHTHTHTHIYTAIVLISLSAIALLLDPSAYVSLFPRRRAAAAAAALILVRPHAPLSAHQPTTRSMSSSSSSSSRRCSEFENRAFSVVDQQFASSTTTMTTTMTHYHHHSSSSTRHGQGRRHNRWDRLGVGAQPSETGDNNNNNNNNNDDDTIVAMATKRMMQVGRRNTRNRSSSSSSSSSLPPLWYVDKDKQERAVDEMDNQLFLKDNNNNNDHDDNNDEEEEEEAGRTAIAVEPKQPRQSVVATLVPKSMEGDQTKVTTTKKKKKRKRKATASQVEPPTQETIQPESANLAPDQPFTLSTHLQNQPDDTVPNQTEPSTSTVLSRGSNPKKRQRPNKRSRQKNICKDTRNVADQPAHLIPGATRTYRGRPLTAATRHKLDRLERQQQRQLPPPSPPPKHQAPHWDAGQAVIVGDSLDSMMPLVAVDQVAAGERMVTDPASASFAKATKSKKKTTKYKNLM